MIRYHPSLSIQRALSMPREQLKGQFRNGDGKPVSPGRALVMLRALARSGLEYVPRVDCDHQDPLTGQCLGHDVPALRRRRRKERIA